MNVSYKGITKSVPPGVQAKLDRKFQKLSKLLEKRGERQAHVVVTEQRNRMKAEVTIQFHDHQLVGIATETELFTALSEAMAKIEAQAVKQRDKWREKTRRHAPPKGLAGIAASSEVEPAQRIYRAKKVSKPITLEEAVLALDGKKKLPYVAFNDVTTGSLSVLVRRDDGHLDLIEG